MLRALLQTIFHRPLYRFGKVDNTRIRRTTLRNAQFVSFMAQQGLGRARHTDRHDSRLRRQKFGRLAVICAVGTFVVWVGIESARALAMF